MPLETRFLNLMKKNGQQSVNQYRTLLDYSTVIHVPNNILPQAVWAVDAAFIVPLFVFALYVVPPTVASAVQALQALASVLAVSATGLYVPAGHAVQVAVPTSP